MASLEVLRWYKEAELFLLLHFSCICHSTKHIQPHSVERGLLKKAESYKLNFISPKESRKGGCEMEQYMGGKRAAQCFGFSCKFPGLLVSPLCVWRAEHCQQLHLMGKGSNELLITERCEFSDLIFSDIGTEFSQPLHLLILKS